MIDGDNEEVPATLKTLERRALIGSIAGVPEEVPAFSGLEQAADVADGAPERIVGPGACSSQMGLELGEGHLDRIEVGRVGREKQEPGAPPLQRSSGLGGLVHLQIVEDDDVARLQGGSE